MNSPIDYWKVKEQKYRASYFAMPNFIMTLLIFLKLNIFIIYLKI